MVVDKNAVPMREQTVEQRIGNFDEVPLGYNVEEAVKEARRCMQCVKKPCVEGCPVHIDIPVFIKALKENDYQKAIDIIHNNDSLPCVTGRVCPQEEQCQAVCLMKKAGGEPISIGRLERFLADWDLDNRKNKKCGRAAHSGRKGDRVAVVGSGPAGLTCAAELAKNGY
ncbi:MAG: dihydropyrimidine dehydrogenase, partial [Candidatus Omnitrophica bacterium]|nr:dihydropyrimidine dehydrogenase [Candidatus Omnitrophota bacterium]